MGERDFQHVTHRVLRRLIAYWLDKRSQRAMPSRCDIDPIEIPWALEWIWLCDYRPADRRFRFRLAGEQVNAFWGSNIGRIYLEDEVFATGERIILPLSDDGREVSGLLGASCRDWHRDLELGGVLRSWQTATVTPLGGGGPNRQVDRSTLNFTP